MPAWPRLGFAAGLSAMTGVLSSLDPLLIRQLIDIALPSRRLAFALGLVAGIAGCLLGRALLLIGSIQSNFILEQRLAQTLRGMMFYRLTQLSADYHEQASPGDGLSRLSRDVEQISAFAAEFPSTIVYALLFFTINIWVMLRINARIVLWVLPCLGILWFVRASFSPILRKQATAAERSAGNASSVVCEYLTALPQIQLMAAERLAIAQTTSSWSELIACRLSQRRMESAFSALNNSVLVLSILVVLSVASFYVVRGDMTVGGLVAFYAFSTRTFEPLASLMELYSRVQRVGASIIRVRDILEREASVRDLGTITIVDSRLHTGMCLDGISFRYKSAGWALLNVSLHIRPGEQLVIAGKSGSGKSTLGRLLVRLWDPNAGEIRLESRPLSAYKLGALRRVVCYLPQNPVLFNASLEENLLYARPDASCHDIKRVLRVAQLESVLDRLPEGLQTRIGASGQTLSGGERQRLALARALLQNSPVLILDESTSALDVATEERVLHGIARECAPSILIVISHRLSSVRWINEFVVLDRGQIAAVGNHEELIRGCALYRQLYRFGQHPSAN